MVNGTISGGSSDSQTLKLVGAVVAAILVTIAVMLLIAYCIYRKRRSAHESQCNENLNLYTFVSDNWIFFLQPRSFKWFIIDKYRQMWHTNILRNFSITSCMWGKTEMSGRKTSHKVPIEFILLLILVAHTFLQPAYFLPTVLPVSPLLYGGELLLSPTFSVWTVNYFD